MHEALTEIGKRSPKKKNNLCYFRPYFLVPLLNLFLNEIMEYWTTLNYK